MNYLKMSYRFIAVLVLFMIPNIYSAENVAFLIRDQGVNPVLTTETRTRISSLYASGDALAMMEVPSSEFAIKGSPTLTGLMDKVAVVKKVNWVVHISLEKGSTSENIVLSVYNRNSRETVLDVVEIVRSEQDIIPVLTGLASKIRKVIRAELAISANDLFMSKTPKINPQSWKIPVKKLNAGNMLLYAGLAYSASAVLAYNGASPSDPEFTKAYAISIGVGSAILLTSIIQFISAAQPQPYKVADVNLPVNTGSTLQDLNVAFLSFQKKF